MREIYRGAWLLAILSGILQVLIFPLPDVYPLCWVATAPLLLALLRARNPKYVRVAPGLSQPLLPASPLQGFFLGYVSGVIWYAGTCFWVYHTMHLYGGLSASVALGVLVLFCLYLALYHGLFGFLTAVLAAARPNGVRRALFFSPFLWVAVELARTRISAFPWDLLGTAQIDNISLNRVATITGVYGLSFEIMLVNTVFAAAFMVPSEKRKLILIEALIAAAALQLIALIKPAPLKTDHSALLLQEDIPILEPSAWTAQYYEGTLADLSRRSTSLPARSAKPDLIVWPESPAPFYVNDPKFNSAVAAVAQQDEAYVVAGSLGTHTPQGQNRPPELYNSAALMSPQGAWVARYDKIHLVPFGEYVPFKALLTFAQKLTREVGEFGRGESRAPLSAGSAKLGVFICYESVFPDEVRQFALNGAQVLINISNDGWYGNTGAFAQHLNQARMRAVENHRWLLRSTNTGLTASIDPYGRIVTRAPREVRTTLEAPYALLSGTTFYTRYGDWFAYGCAIIFIGALLARFRAPATREI